MLGQAMRSTSHCKATRQLSTLAACGQPRIQHQLTTFNRFSISSNTNNNSNTINSHHSSRLNNLQNYNYYNSSHNIINTTKTNRISSINSINNSKNTTNSNNNNLSNKNIYISKRHQSQTFLTQHHYALCFLGAPGVGKGTYSSHISKNYGAKVLSSGDLIRECAKLNEGTALGNELTECINNGQLVPDDIVIPMVIDYLRLVPNSFILDGFPRTYNQAKRIHTEYQLSCVLYFKLPDEVLIKKILGRRVCPNCKANFNVADINEGEIVMPSMAPKKEGICNNCNHELTTRPDDTEETVSERLRIFHEETGPIEQFYKQSGLLLEYNVKKGMDDLPDIVGQLKSFLERYAIPKDL